MDHVESPIRVELAWSPRAGEVLRRMLSLPQGATIGDALARCGWDLPDDVVSGVWGRVRDPSHTLCDGDRLELLRPLGVDPKEARRLRHRARQTPSR